MFFLECGAEVHSGKGEHTIGFDYCPWRLLRDGRELVSGNDALAMIDEQIPRLVGLSVEGIELQPDTARACITLSGDVQIETAHNSQGSQWYVLQPGLETTVGYRCQVTSEPIVTAETH